MTIDRRVVALLGAWLFASETLQMLASDRIGGSFPVASFFVHGVGVVVGLVLLVAGLRRSPADDGARKG